MIGRLRGQVAGKRAGRLLLEVAGVGYDVAVPARLLGTIAPDTEVLVYTYLVVREDALSLYGFATEYERDVFERLLDISGIGPKLALAILSVHDPDSLQHVVTEQNVAALQAVPGVGKRGAERILVELKNHTWAKELPIGQAANGHSPLWQALVGLGYSAAEVAEISRDIDIDLPLQDQIKQALAKLARA